MSEALTARGGARGGSSRGRGRSAAVAMRGRARPATAPGTNADEAGEVPLEAVSAAEPMRRLPGPDLNNKRIIKVSMSGLPMFSMFSSPHLTRWAHASDNLCGRTDVQPTRS